MVGSRGSIGATFVSLVVEIPIDIGDCQVVI